MIRIGTLCLCISASARHHDLVGLECVVTDHGPLYGRVNWIRIAHPYRIEFKDGRRFLAFDRNVIPLLDPPIEITARGVRELVPA